MLLTLPLLAQAATQIRVELFLAVECPISNRYIPELNRLANIYRPKGIAFNAYFPEPGELENLPLRRRPKVDRNVRVVQIGVYDVSPCGGAAASSGNGGALANSSEASLRPLSRSPSASFWTLLSAKLTPLLPAVS